MVELKKKVTLRAKTPEVPAEAQKPKVALRRKQPVPEQSNTPIPPTGSDEEPKGKGKWYAAALAGLLVLGIGGYYLSQQGEDESQPAVAVASTDQSEDVAKGETAEGNQNEQSQESETPADAASAENPSGEAPAGETPAAATPATLGSKTNATAPASGSTPAALATSKLVQEKPKANPVQSKPVAAPSSATGTVEEEAIEVIRGKYGNGAVRKRNLGDRYAEIQSKVNEMYRNGQVQ